MRVFVTGGSGYVGAHIVRCLLASGHEVTVLSRDPGRLATPRVPGLRLVRGDLRAGWDDRSLRDHDACVHAAIVWEDEALRPEEDDVAATRGLVASAVRVGCPHVLYVSSVAVHRPFAAQMSEADPIAPTDAYGGAKAAGEALLAELRERHALRASCVRAGPVVGAPAFPGGRFRSDRRITEIVAAARRGAPIRVGHGEGRQLTPADGLARVVRALLEHVSAPDLVVAVAREVTSWESIAADVVAQLGSASLVEVTAPLPGDVVSRFETRRVERLLGEPLDTSCSLRAHLAALVAGIAPTP